MMSQFLAPACCHLSTASAATTILSSSAAKSKLLKTFDPDKALSILSNSSTSNPSSSRFALDLTIRRLARSGRFSEIDSLVQSHKNSHPAPHQEPFLSTLILSYGSASMLTNARQLFDEIPQPTSNSFNAMLSACNKAKKPNLVEKLFNELQSKHVSVKPDEMSYGILVKSFCLSGKVGKAMEVVEEMKGKGMNPSLVVYSTMIDGFYKKGRKEEAEKVWEEMVGSGLKPDLAAYNVKVMYPALNGKPEEVLEVMKEMEGEGLKPDAISYNYLVTCYCKNGMLEKAKECYGEFKKKKIEPNAAIFKVLVRNLCEGGDFDGALEVCRDSMKRNKIPEFKITKILVEGLVKRGKVEEAKEVIGVVKERFPKEMLGGWKKVEEELGLTVDEETSESSETGEADSSETDKAA